MDYKYIAWLVLFLAVIISSIGFFWFIVIFAGILSFLLGCITILYLQHDDLDKFLGNGLVENPLQETKNLGLGGVCEPKPSNLLLISPDIKIQTEAKNRSNQNESGRKKNLLDAGIELFFKSKHAKEITNRLKGHGSQEDTILDSKEPTAGTSGNDEKKWKKPFENIKIYTERKRSPSTERGGRKKEDRNVQIGEDCATGIPSFKSYISDTYETNGDSPRRRKILSGCKPIDKLVHTIIDYVIRDYLDSWYSYVSDSKEFTDIVVRETVEASVINICQRIKHTLFLPLMTTKLIDDLSTHMKLYRLASQEVESSQKLSSSNFTANEQKRMRLHEKLSPQKKSIHRRNKSDTDLSWHLQKNVANSKFYTATPNEESLVDPETMLLNSFFNNSELYKKESLDDDALVEHLKIVTESILYFVLPEEEFDCMLLRTFLCNLLANVIFKPVVHMLADPDFINLQIAKQFIKEPPSGEFLLKMIRQSNDLSELRAVRQLITREMDLKYKDISCKAELDSLKYTQKIIDLRISSLQNNRNDTGKPEKERFNPSLPILTLDDILSKELAVSYYLDYLSILNLQKYVLFYLAAQEWKLTTSHLYSEIQVNKAKSKDEAMKDIRDKAQHLFNEYLVQSATNHLNVDSGLVEALNIRIKDMSIQPENTWFDSICKFVYEKLKNEEVFLSSFYQSSAYKKLLFELDVIGQQQQESDIESSINDGGSDTCSGDFLIDVTDEDEGPTTGLFENDIKEEHDVHLKTEIVVKPQAVVHLSGIATKHARSHSDCTGILTNMGNITIEQLKSPEEKAHIEPPPPPIVIERHEHVIQYKQKLAAKIINTALHVEGNYAVYAIQVFVIEDNQQKSWHIYRRYSKFLELKKFLVKKFPRLSKIPFPTKKVFQNTQRAVLEHRMAILNLFLEEICSKSENDDEMHSIIRNFLEPDTDDRKMYGGVVVKTIESLKSGMRTIRNMPDTLVGGISRIFLGKGPLKIRSFYDLSYEIEQSEYPALESMLNLLDEAFDLQNKSQWLRRGLINRVLGAPWISHATNKKIIHTAKMLLEMDKVESVLLAILNTIWPHGERHNPHQIPIREDSTKLRTKMAAKISLFALLFDDLKHVVGTVTCNAGLLLFFQMLQNKKLNIRLVLILLDHVLTLIFQTDSLTKHVVGTGGGGATSKAESTPNSNASSRKPSRF